VDGGVPADRFHDRRRHRLLKAWAFSVSGTVIEETSAVNVLGNTIGFRRAQALRKTKVGPRQTCD